MRERVNDFYFPPSLVYQLGFSCDRGKICGRSVVSQKLATTDLPQTIHLSQKKICGRFCGKSVIGILPVVDLPTSAHERHLNVINKLVRFIKGLHEVEIKQ